MNRKFNQKTQLTNRSAGRVAARTVASRVAGAAAGVAVTMVCAGQLMASTVVNINTASADAIANALDGIGLIKAQAIVEHRETQGLFKTPDDIMQVKGIGKATYQQIRHYLKIDKNPAAQLSTEQGALAGNSANNTASNTVGNTAGSRIGSNTNQ